MYMELLYILLPFILLPVLIRYRVIPPAFRLVTLAWYVLVVFAYELSHSSLNELGLRSDNLQAGLLPFATCTLAMFLCLLLFSAILKTKKKFKWKKDPHFLFLFIPISIAQQLIFQVYLLQSLLEYTNPLLAIITTAALFGFLHTIYPRPWFNFLVTTAGGIVFASLYYLYPNILLASLSHMIVNVTAIYLGFFTMLTASGTPKVTSLNIFKSN